WEVRKTPALVQTTISMPHQVAGPAITNAPTPSECRHCAALSDTKQWQGSENPNRHTKGHRIWGT
uniref:Uncharacterized protein n=1 Tax=Panagrolaimus sp. JU765 TaxID=591449 RepID=A0AC34QY46_9BILA